MPFRRRHLRRGTLGPPPPKPKVSLADPHQPLWLIEGLKMIGTHEAPGRGNNQRIIQMARRAGFRNYRSDSIPWCALFANYCCAVAGQPGTGSLLALSFNSSSNFIRLPGPAV